MPLLIIKPWQSTFFNAGANGTKTDHYITVYKASKKAMHLEKQVKLRFLAAILYQRCHDQDILSSNRIKSIMAVLLKSQYEYVLRNYLKIYYFESGTSEGKQFAEMLRGEGFEV